MEKKDFYEYAKKCNQSLKKKAEHIERMRDIRLSSENYKTIEIANYIQENSPIKMQFEVCLDTKFAQYNRNWANIYLPEQKIFIFIIDNDFDRDIIFQLWRYKKILIFDIDTNIDFVSEELFRKMKSINDGK